VLILSIATHVHVHHAEDVGQSRNRSVSIAHPVFPGGRQHHGEDVSMRIQTESAEESSMSASAKSVLLLGATGLVGGECLKLFAPDAAFASVVVLTRKPFQTTSSPRVECHQVNFDDPTSFKAHLNVDTVICALGTTIRKAGSQEAFRKVDHEYPLMFAKLALEGGARHFLLVSSAGANTQSRVFYSYVKGEIEAAVSNLGYPALSIFRPSLLLGHRTEFRLGELISQKIVGPLGFLMPRSVRPIQASQVAAAIVNMAHSDASGVRFLSNADML
jgi:uncharacterized protein YbjT (DUF2867 family)